MRSHEWIGAETYRKEADFAGLVGGIHVPICRSIRDSKGRPGDPPYLYMDLHAGPGRLVDDCGRQFDGSPVIALTALQESGLPYETWHFEKNPAVAKELADLLHAARQANTRVCNVEFEVGVRWWLERTLPHKFRYGQVYSDPIGDPIPVDALNLVAEHSPRVDFLAYVAANNQYKRANGSGHGHGRRLADDIAAVRKERVLIREPAGAEQYTFILFTNWTVFPEWKRRGFYELRSSGRGRDILDDLNLTKRERHQQLNVPLWSDDVA